MLSKNDVNSLPDKPGVYLFKDRSSKILYIGKAKSLRARVRTYTYRNYRHSRRTRRLVRLTKSLDYILCGSELEALLLESRLIKEHLPEYNVFQRRFRNYPFVKITLNEEFPRIFVAWEIELDGAKYLGPFPRWDRAEETVEIIHRLFPLRKCEKDTFSQKSPCLNYYIKRCTGPCSGKITSTDYRKMINTIITLLSGKKEKLIRDMEIEMNKASANLQFEKAAIIRDRINGIKEAIFRRQFQVNAVDNNNLIAIYPSKDTGFVEMFFIKKGGLVDQKKMSLQASRDNELLQTIMADIERIFFNASTPTSKSVSQLEVDAMNIISRWLYRHRKDQSFVHIKRKRNKADSILSAAKEVKRIIELFK